MKKLFAIAIIIIAFLNLQASDWVNVTSDQPAQANVSLISSQITQSSVQFTLNGFWKDEVLTDHGNSWLISLENGAPSLLQGAPDLPIFTSSVIVPDMSQMKVNIISSQYVEFTDVLIAPSKGNLTRDVDPETIPYEFGKQYDNDAFYPGELAKINEPYIIRDLRGQAIHFQPFQYNPVSKTLRVYFDVTIEVVEDGISSVNTIDRTDLPSKMDFEFMNIYNRHFMNFNSANRYDPVGEHGNMLVICYADFMGEMEPFIEWKTMTGMPVEMVDVAEIGNAAAIKQYIADYYNDNGLTFVLLVGDAQQVPSSIIGGKDSDNNYSYVVGNDHYPDLFVGRFSAQTDDHVITQVQRTIDYEKNPIDDNTDWYTKCMSVGSNQGPGDDGEYDYEHLRNISDNKLIPFTYDYVYEFFDGSQGGNDSPGNPSASAVGVAVDEGVTVINYTGHGSTTSWGSSGFSNSNVNQLSNNGKLPFIISVACVNGNFVNSTCFAEAWLRAEANDEPAGAIATLMSTINQSWNPPMRGQDEMADIMTEAYEDNIKRTFGGITMNGCMNMNDVYGSGGDEMTDTWTIFGDPSLVIRTAVPVDLTVTHPTALLLGQSSMDVTCETEGAIVALSLEGAILGSALIEDGSATIEFETLENVGTADFVVTAFNHKPYITTIDIIPADGPFLVYEDYIVNDEAGNNNGEIDYAESILLSVGLFNLGGDPAIDVQAELTTESEYIIMTQQTTSYGDILAGETGYPVTGFGLDVSEITPDGQEVDFQISIQDTDERAFWQYNFSVTVHAPVLEYVDYSIDDSNGNDNGKLDPGETANIVVEIVNNGSSEAYNLLGQLTSLSEYVSININEVQYGDLDENENGLIIFNVTAAADAPDGHSAAFEFNLIADHNISTTGNFNVTVGQIPVVIIDLSDESSTPDAMTACLETLQVGKEILTTFPDDLNVYKSVFIILGISPNNNELSSEQSGMLASYMSDGGFVYLEGSDAWYADEQTEAHNMFMIEATSNGSGDLTNLLGQQGSIGEGFVFSYDGPNVSIDKISPKQGAKLVFKNMSPSYGAAVSFENDDYKTIGTSFEFGGLTDSDHHKKDDLMAKYLESFEIPYMWVGIPDNNLDESAVNAYPNPFSNTVNIEVNLKKTSYISVEVYDLTGRIIQSLADKELSADNYTFEWDATMMEPGLYFYTVRVGNKAITRKLVLSR